MSQFRRRLLMMMQKVQEVWRDVVLTGTGLVVANDTTAGQPVKIFPQGWTTQDGTPTPESPVPILNAGTYNEETGKYEYGLKLEGKNLVPDNIDDWQQGGYSTTGEYELIGYRICLKNYVKIDSGYSVYFNVGNDDYGFVIRTYDKNKSFYRNMGFVQNRKTISFLPDESYISISIQNKNASNFDLSEFYNVSVFACYNSYDNSYFPYQPPQSVTLTSDRPLTKWDRLVYIDGQWQWEYGEIAINLNGSELWTIYIKGFKANRVLPENMISRDGFCDRFSAVNSLQDKVSNSMNIGIWSGSGSNDLYLPNVPDFYNVDLEDYGLQNWKDYLSENPLFIQTYTDSPIYVPLPESEQQALNALTAYYPTTVFSNDQNGFMQIEYRTKYGGDA